MYCAACGASNETTAKFCQGCGAATAGPAVVLPGAADGGTMRGMPVSVTPGTLAPAVPKNPVVAAVLSAIIVGLGQFYNGDMKKGGIMLLGALVLGVATAGLLWLAVAIWSAVDAYQVANGTGRRW